MMKVVKDVVLKCLLISLGLLVGFLLVELGLRFFVYKVPAYKASFNDFIQPHPELGWSHIPNKEGYWTVGKRRVHVKINSKGLRDREYPYEKKKETFRILVLGDSFTEALQVPLKDTFCKVLECELNKTHTPCEVINGGFGGVGSDYELLFFKREGYKYHPDLVIIACFPTNDIYDNYRSINILMKGPLAYEKKGPVASLRQFLAQRSFTYNYFGTMIPKYMPQFAKLLMKLGLLSFQPIDNAHGVNHLHYQVFRKNYGADWEKAWDVTRIMISELKKEVEDHGSDLAIISIPCMEQVHEELWKSKLSKPGMAEQEWDLSKPDRILLEFLDDAEIPFLPLLSHFRKAAEKSELYYQRDGHWNVDGHYLAGQVIHNWLVDERLVPISDGHLQAGKPS